MTPDPHLIILEPVVCLAVLGLVLSIGGLVGWLARLWGAWRAARDLRRARKIKHKEND